MVATTTDTAPVVERPLTGVQRVRCPRCHAAEGERCRATNGPARYSHMVRWDVLKNALRTRQFLVQILTTDARTGVIAGETYVARTYPYDNKVTLLARVPDGHDPEVNQYWSDVLWLSWVQPE